MGHFRSGRPAGRLCRCSGGGGNSAYFVENGIAERRAIRAGAVSLDAVEIVAGAKEGDRIVVTGTDVFANAQRVRIAD